jgi:hypothetical protein
LIPIYFFVLTDRGFSGARFCKSFVKGQDDFYRDKVTSECRSAPLTRGCYG